MKQLDKQRECVALGECRPRHSSKKDTRRWCRGREGIEHHWEWRARQLSSLRQPGEMGYQVEEEYCRACERPRDRYAFYTLKDRRRCHCGELMRRLEVSYQHPSGPDVSCRNAARCDACAYEPSSYLPTVWVNGREELAIPRRRCQCEAAAEKAAKRAHYEQMYGVSPLPAPPEQAR